MTVKYGQDLVPDIDAQSATYGQVLPLVQAFIVPNTYHQQ